MGIIPYFLFRTWFAVSITTKTFLPLFIACVINGVSYPFLSYWVVFDKNMGIAGLSLSIGLSSMILSTTMIGMSFFFKSFRSSFIIGSFSEVVTFTHVQEICRLGLPSILMTLLNFMFWQKSQLILQW